jgi:hypothetical protein
MVMYALTDLGLALLGAVVGGYTEPAEVRT